MAPFATIVRNTSDGDAMMEEIFGPIYARRDYAGFIRRTAAFVFDLLLLAIVYVGISVGVSLAFPESPPRQLEAWLGMGFWVLLFIYFIGFRLFANGTPGYRLMRIRYVYMLGERPPVLTVLFRAVAAAILVWIFALDHLWILFDDRKQAWHDKITGFYVVKRHAEPAGEARMVQRVVNILAMTLVVWEPREEQWFAAPSQSPPSMAVNPQQHQSLLLADS
jgi:uncharacterized RDD family membrane protein YckC